MAGRRVLQTRIPQPDDQRARSHLVLRLRFGLGIIGRAGGQSRPRNVSIKRDQDRHGVQRACGKRADRADQPLPTLSLDGKYTGPGVSPLGGVVVCDGAGASPARTSSTCSLQRRPREAGSAPRSETMPWSAVQTLVATRIGSPAGAIPGVACRRRRPRTRMPNAAAPGCRTSRRRSAPPASGRRGRARADLARRCGTRRTARGRRSGARWRTGSTPGSRPEASRTGPSRPRWPPDRLAKLREAGVEHGANQRALVREVQVDRRRRDADLARDRPQRQPLDVAGLGQDPVRRRDQLRAATTLALGLRARRACVGLGSGGFLDNASADRRLTDILTPVRILTTEQV